MPSLPAMLLGSLLLFMATVTASQPGRRGRRKVYQFQHGQCSYTFMLPELQPCARDSRALGASNILPRDPPASVLHLKHRPGHRVRQLEKALENNTQWLQKLERYLQMSLRPELTRTQKHIVRNQTASVLELSSSLQNRTSAQAHKLTDMEAQILNQTSRMEGQMLETLLSTDKLERQLGLHSRELLWLDDRNSNLETRVRALETQQEAQLASLRQEKERMRHLLGHYNGTLARLEHTLSYARSNSSLLHRQQQELLESVQLLARSLAEGSVSPRMAEQKVFQDCAEIWRSGIKISGIYTIHVGKTMEPRMVFCDMEVSGGGWTLIQRRGNGYENFQRDWKNYKLGFGTPAAEHWLGNEAVHQLTSRRAYSLRVHMQDWEGHEVFSHYEQFQLGSEEQFYRISLSGHSGSAGQKSSLIPGTKFSTFDLDNDNCNCNCAQLQSGGWWFDACGPSNLNGAYYSAQHHLRKLNGIRWQYFRGASYSLRGTRMMIRPVDA